MMLRPIDNKPSPMPQPQHKCQSSANVPGDVSVKGGFKSSGELFHFFGGGRCLWVGT